MSEFAVATRNLKDDDGNLRTFHYAITVDCLDNEALSLENYGILCLYQSIERKENDWEWSNFS